MRIPARPALLSLFDPVARPSLFFRFRNLFPLSDSCPALWLLLLNGTLLSQVPCRPPPPDFLLMPSPLSIGVVCLRLFHSIILILPRRSRCFIFACAPTLLSFPSRLLCNSGFVRLSPSPPLKTVPCLTFDRNIPVCYSRRPCSPSVWSREEFNHNLLLPTFSPFIQFMPHPLFIDFQPLATAIHLYSTLIPTLAVVHVPPFPFLSVLLPK